MPPRPKSIAKTLKIQDVQLEDDTESQPFRQYGAGLSDIVTSLPILAGVIGAGSVAGYRTLSTDLQNIISNFARTQGEDDERVPSSFSDNFVDAITQGIDEGKGTGSARLFRAGMAGRDAANEFFGVGEAKGTIDQIARLLGNLTPFPGLRTLPGGGFGTNTLRHIYNLATPAIRVEKTSTRPFRDRLINEMIDGTIFNSGNVVRLSAQTGIGTGIDQGIRAFADDKENLPMMFEGKFDNIDFSFMGEAQATTLMVDDVILEGDAPSIEEGGVVLNADEVQLEDTPPTGLEIQQAIEDEETSSTIKAIAIAGGTALAVILGAKYSRYLLDNRIVSTLPPIKQKDLLAENFSELNTTLRESGVRATLSRAGAKIRQAGNVRFGDIFDANQHIETALRMSNVSETDINQITGMHVVDPYGVVEQFLRDGRFGQGSGRQVRSLFSIKREFDAMSRQDQVGFQVGIDLINEDIARVRATAADALLKDVDDAIPGLRQAFEEGDIDDINLILRQQAELIDNIRGTSKRVRPGLWRDVDMTGPDGVVRNKKVFIEDDVIREGVFLFNNNPKFVQMHKALTAINRAVLDESVRRGVVDKAWADGMFKQFTVNGQGMYLPGKELMERVKWYKRLSTALGGFTTTGKNLNGVSNWHLKGLVEGQGIQSPLDAFNATANYTYQVMKHVNDSSNQWNVLSRLSALSLGPNGAPIVGEGASDAKYIGLADLNDPGNQSGQIKVDFLDDPDVKIAFNLGESATMTPQQLAKMNEVIWVQRGSKYYGFQVKDAGLKNALEFDSMLHNRLLQHGRTMKNLFSSLQTGKASVFGPTAFMYNQQLATLNAALRAEGGIANMTREASAAWFGSFKGAYDVFTVRMAEDYADMLTRSIAENSALFRANPDLIRKMRIALKRRTRGHMVNRLQSEIGRTSSGLGASDYAGNLINVMEKSIPYISKTYGAGALPQFRRIWDHLNTALHEGTGMALTMRRAMQQQKAYPTRNFDRIAREARIDANKLVGNVKLRGSSPVSDYFHAFVPFSGAMAQGFATIGSSIRKAGAAKTIGRLTAVIGTPTALEVMYNNGLDTGELFADPSGNGKMWSYRDYYWNGFTPEQRNNNVIVFKPGQDPWEAVMMPLTPEMAVLHAVYIDALEIVMGLSEHTIHEPNHIYASVTRLFDFPLPPSVAAGLAMAGIDLRLGVLPDDTKGEGVSVIQGRSMFRGSRGGTSDPHKQYASSELDKDTVAILQAIFANGASLGIGFYEGLFSGDENTPLNTRLGFAFDSLGSNVKSQMRYLQPLWGKSVGFTPDRDVIRDLLQKRSGLQRAQSLLSLQEGKQRQFPVMSNTTNAPLDPITKLLSEKAGEYLEAIADLDIAIGQYRGFVNQMGTGTVNQFRPGRGPGAKNITFRERKDIIDGLNQTIGGFQAIQLTALTNLEKEFINAVKNELGLDASGFAFNNFKAPPNPPKTTLQEIRQTPR